MGRAKTVTRGLGPVPERRIVFRKSAVSTPRLQVWQPPPRTEATETRFLTPSEVERLASNAAEAYGNLIQLAARTRLRRGEIFAQETPTLNLKLRRLDLSQASTRESWFRSRVTRKPPVYNAAAMERALAAASTFPFRSKS
jgi:hypothetical protein